MKPNQKITTSQAQAAVAQYGGIRPAARELGVNPKTVRAHINRARDFEIDDIPEDGRPIDELLEARKAEFARVRQREEATQLIGMRIKLDGPIGIAHIGDPHVDDPGTDIALLEEHLTLVRETPGMYAANVGDMQNNWVGRLAHLYSEETVTALESWKLVEWMINICRDKWLYLVGGNHDAWSGQRDPLEWIARQACAHIQYYGVRMELQFPNKRRVRVNTRHDFAGWSMWNKVHAAMKAAQMGFRDHILTCGHKHVSGYGMSVDPDPVSGVVSHCIRVASYKKFDTYAKKLGAWAHNISPCAVTIIDPDAKREAGLVQVFWEPQEAAGYLTWKRRKAA